jgi:hypothetical protein
MRAGFYREKPTFGVGLNIPLKSALLRFDYAFTSHEELGRSQIVGASFDM